jgi:hypothetical protein
MATPYPVELSLSLRPIHHQRPLSVNIGIDQNMTTVHLTNETVVHFKFDAIDSCCLTIELPDKIDQEAVVIEDVSFFGIKDPKFAWTGVYEPVYPEPWATEQRSQGVALNPQLSPHTYLGWPGKWTLTFDVPVFTWIHKTQNLGWIYG